MMLLNRPALPSYQRLMRETLIRGTAMKKLRSAGRDGDTIVGRDDMPIIVMSLVSLAVLVIFGVT
jgi:hypothetical protein